MLPLLCALLSQTPTVVVIGLLSAACPLALLCDKLSFLDGCSVEPVPGFWW